MVTGQVRDFSRIKKTAGRLMKVVVRDLEEEETLRYKVVQKIVDIMELLDEPTNS